MAGAPAKKSRWPWLVVAALLFAAGAWLMSGSEAEKTTREKKVSLPRSMTGDERKRNTERQTIPVLAAPAGVDGAPPPPPQVRDPVLAAMPTSVKSGAVVIEANAIRNSDLGNLMIECVFTGRTGGLERMKDAGFDPLESLDRVAIADDAMMLTGDFSKTDFPSLMNADHQRQFGQNSELYARRLADGGAGQQLGVWKDQVLVLGDTEDDVTTVLDRLDGKGDQSGPRVLTQADAYGEIYGVLKPGAFAAGIADENPALAQLLTEAASSIKLHADVSHDVGLVAEIEGSDPAKTQDLRKALGTALTLAKLQAEAKGNKDAAEVLGFARVGAARGTSPNFHLEAGLPYEFLELQLKKCVDEKKKRLAAKQNAPQVAH